MQNSALLKCQKAIFHEEKIKESLACYRALLADKLRLAEKLSTLRSEINAASLKLLENYQGSINKLLKSFGVEFCISKIEQKADTARKETLIFAIELKGLTFDPKGTRGAPYSLANILSSGDKSTLTFALFMAKLQHDDLKNTIVVFDDPISSLDFFRKLQTSKQISEITNKAKQVIVLTHSMVFTKLFIMRKFMFSGLANCISPSLCPCLRRIFSLNGIRGF